MRKHALADESLTDNSPGEPTLKPRELPNFTTEDFFGRKAGRQMVKTVNGVEYVFRWCPDGTFMMGSPEGDWWRCGEIQHSVTLTGAMRRILIDSVGVCEWQIKDVACCRSVFPVGADFIRRRVAAGRCSFTGAEFY